MKISGIIVGQGHHISRMRAFKLSLAYVLGMAVTYAALGAFAFSATTRAPFSTWTLTSPEAAAFMRGELPV